MKAVGWFLTIREGKIKKFFKYEIPSPSTNFHSSNFKLNFPIKFHFHTFSSSLISLSINPINPTPAFFSSPSSSSSFRNKPNSLRLGKLSNLDPNDQSSRFISWILSLQLAHHDNSFLHKLIGSLVAFS